jgi:putative chitinase
MKLEADVIKKLWPKALWAKIDAIAETSEEVFEEFGIDDPTVVAHLMGNISHENGAGTIVRESGAYRPARLVQIFGAPQSSAAVTIEEAEALQGHPEAIFERVYNLPKSPKLAKMLGNHEPGDGFKFRGNGDLQLTGRESHARIGKMIGVDLVGNPDQLEDPKISFRVACAEFAALGCIPWAKADNVTKVRRLVNGGTNGLDEVGVWIRKWKEALPDIEAPPQPPRAADSTNGPKLMQSKIAQGTVVSAATTTVGIGAQVTSYLQTTSDAVTTAKTTTDNAVQIVHTVKPIFGLLPDQMMGIAIGCAIVALAVCGYTFWQRYKKLRDQGV